MTNITLNCLFYFLTGQLNETQQELKENNELVVELQGILFIPQTHDCMQPLLHKRGVVLSPCKLYELWTSVAPQSNTTICVLEPK